ncbi:TetR family transcriptional regulator [Xanthomonas citri pv. citri]|uniref:Transcriptional regulator tetR family n=5 Tax=Xanthomonas citri TaxID=346 RepID=A0AAI7ZFP8_XANAC|nr:MULTISPECIES: TetR/AcrR family transcriptional regulator [Xanthomonas]AAM37081.1 transcriptional regulator tetR family [Xanthomonas citri pv. citri str. 306]AJD68817.1 transcriptional regulator, TetR family [Xanthomonas citri subsp. citri A306]AJY82343.1 transcriptional regulator, TetR family [Xanthomonas citri pv. citri]AJY86767.1 transcriptional regulator, TetR family [Xanthomonas citri subsp. citri UI6]AJY91198.1 transcriptional regulator, TetR family [Xanthomonas citri pv. citri]
MSPETGPRKRLTKEQRLAQLLDVARQLAHQEGTDALSLGRLAEAAGITKPTVYDHFGTRQGLLAALYRDFDLRQRQVIDAAIAASKPRLEDKACVLARSYIDCVLAEGREIPGVLAALDGSPELAVLKRQCQQDFLEKCRTALAPVAGPKGLPLAGLWAMLGAADTLSAAAVSGEITHHQACDELYEVILSLVQRSKRPSKPS